MSKRQASLLSMGFVKKPKQAIPEASSGAEHAHDDAPTSTYGVQSDQPGPSTTVNTQALSNSG